MMTKSFQYWYSPAFRFLVLILLLIGIFFRFVALAERPYWHDEVHTLLRASGYTIAQITTQIFNGQLIERSELLQFQQITPEKTWLDMMRSLIAEEPHRVPLYCAIVRLWIQRFGNDVAVLRSLSAIFSLLVFPALYWLCIELFAQPLIAWIAMMLMSVSPFHVYYAQEVREYAFWTVAILVMSAALLRAIRVQTKAAWIVYGMSIVVSLYTMLLSIPLVASHALYPNNRKVLFWGFSLSIPWLMLLGLNLSQAQKMNAWMAKTIPIQALISDWISNLQFLFLTENITGRFNLVFASAIVLLVFLSIKSLIQHSPRTIWSFVLLLIVPLVLCIAVPDLVLGGLRSTNSRYFVPTYLGIQIAVAHWLATQIQSGQYQTYWKFVLLTILTAGVLSCSAQIFQNQIHDDKTIAAIINRSQNAIVISNEVSYQGAGTIGDILALSHLVRPETRFQLVIQPQVPIIPNQPDIYVYKPLSYLQKILQQSYQLQPIYKQQLFRLLPK